MDSELPTYTLSASEIVCMTDRHAVVDPVKVAALFASMDSNADHFVWDGPPLVIEHGALMTGVHRQAALKIWLAQYDDVEVPVIDREDITSAEMAEMVGYENWAEDAE